MAAWIDAGRRDSPAHPWLAEVVFAFDAILRHRLQVVEYSTDPACIFRLNLSRAEQHLWNEQIPPVPSAGPTLSWARTFCGRLDLSMRELARYFSGHPDLNDVAAIGANVAQGTREQRAQLTNIMRRFGFAPLPDGECTCAEAALRRFAENVLISAMVWARNPVVLRADSLWRDRTPLFVSRTALLERYGIRQRVTSSLADGLWRTR
jgi:hypothetical protein